MRLRQDLIVVTLTLVGVAAVLLWIDLSPRVETEFFFSADDPQLAATAEIARRFPSPEQIVLRVPGDLEAQAHRARVDALADSLRAVPGVIAAYSVATEDPASPLWGRLLTTPDDSATNVILQVDSTDPSAVVPAMESVLREEIASWGAGGEAEIQVSGVPYVIELIRRHLFRDFVIFSAAAMLVFGLVLWLIYRRWAIAGGTIVACLLACAATLIVTHLLDIRIGLLTANIVTIVFVLTLSHIVFLTSNWRWALADGSSRAVRAAVRVTFPASIWCMVTTLLGFLSLLLASARPLRELGLAGALGTATALVVAYLAYPAMLARAGEGVAARASRSGTRHWLPTRRPALWLGGLVVAVALLLPGMWRVNTDPSLLSYFATGTPLREGLEAIDRDGGSSILHIVVRDGEGRLDTDGANRRMWAFQRALEADSAVGVVVSPAVILAHARRQPLAAFLSWTQLLDILSQPLFNRIALSFVTPDKNEGLFFLRMREGRRTAPRGAVVARLVAAAEASGLEVVMTGGVYELQAQLGRLIGRSLTFGLGGLIVLFVLVALVVSRSVSVAAFMVAGLATVPVFVLGLMGHLRLPVDIITSPAANIALAMGVDSMIHLVTRVRRLRLSGSAHADAWLEARRQLWPPIVGATLIISAGFGIFSLSAFPPTQRFGLAVIIGTLSAAAITLIALPFAAGRVQDAG